ncbi:MAG: nitrilase-related carbon-nitrogen hydrolase [Archangium sp.]|nr:nitrilase-related carbon-nitrogen hydrolase [Archangium sp.]MDP3156545.1 nitrilase-related carbon-nitrogen hydrolase [Archangium sp.]MDP3573888.1 nitrilase-related carbon-nitrogen hydrolase [Archangium sp.]
MPVASTPIGSGLTFLLAGLGLGLSGLQPWAWPLAWLAFAGLTFALARAPSRAGALLGLLFFHAALFGLWLHWSYGMTSATFGQGARARWLAAGFVLVEAAPTFLAVGLGALVFHGRAGGRLWLPVAWAAGEALQGALTHVHTEWLFTQAAVSPVLRALGLLGSVPTLLGCLVLAASVGEAMAWRAPRMAWPGVLPLLVLLFAPTLAPADARTFEGVAAVHMRSELEPPLVQGELSLVVWPETAVAQAPALDEGAPVGVTVELLRHQAGAAHHLVGAMTRLVQGKQNSALAVAPGGQVTGARAKRVLFPVTERPFLGAGVRHYTAGRAAPVLEVATRRVIPLVCFEYMTRSLIAEGQAAGGTLLAVLAGDTWQAGSEVAFRQAQAHVRLRAAEFGLPVVYASRGSRSFLVGPDGAVLAESEPGLSGWLTWSPQVGARDERPVSQPRVEVLFSERTPWFRPDCPAGSCRFHVVERFECPAAPGQVVVLAGHGSPPEYLGQPASQLAQWLGCFAPQLVVVDACYGASSPLLAALAPLGPEVIAPAFFVDHGGLRYQPAFYEGGPLAGRSAAVLAPPGQSLLRWRPELGALQAAQARVAAMDPPTLRARVRNWVPTLAAEEVAPGQEVLFPVDWRRVGPR